MWESICSKKKENCSKTIGKIKVQSLEVNFCFLSVCSVIKTGTSLCFLTECRLILRLWDFQEVSQISKSPCSVTETESSKEGKKEQLCSYTFICWMCVTLLWPKLTTDISWSVLTCWGKYNFLWNIFLHPCYSDFQAKECSSQSDLTAFPLINGNPTYYEPHPV